MVYSEPRSLWLAKRADEEAARAGLPDETEISYAVPVRRQGRLAAAFFATIAVPTEDRTNFHVYRPIGRLELDWEDGRLLTSAVRSDVLPVEQDTPIGLSRPPEFVGPAYGEEEERCVEVEGELFGLIDAVAPVFSARGDDPVSRARCLATFRRLVPEAIRPLYEELSPEYFGWLETGVVPAAATCPSCGNTLEAGDRFCPACGRSVATEPVSVPTTPSEPAWKPSHAVPPGGLSAWGAPDPAGPVIARLDPGLRVLVAERAGDWARVVASNGWTGWVDGRSLLPHSS
jgi:hypothetical protein